MRSFEARAFLPQPTSTMSIKSKLLSLRLSPGGTDAVSAADYAFDSPIVLIDGLTKNFRLPGWRCCWVVAPRQLVTALGQSGSYLDGGCSHPTQLAAIPLLEPQRVQQDKEALQQLFLKKRNHVLDRLDKMGLTVRRPVPPKKVSCRPSTERSGAWLHAFAGRGPACRDILHLARRVWPSCAAQQRPNLLRRASEGEDDCRAWCRSSSLTLL